MKFVIIIVIIFSLFIGIIFSTVDVYALSEGDRIRNQYCEHKKQEDPNYDCQFIIESKSDIQPKSTNSISANFDVSSKQIESANDTSNDPSILSIIIIIVFLILTPIAVRQVWRNHSRIHGDQFAGARKGSRAYSARERSRSKEEQERYDEFQQRQKRKEERNRRDDFRKEQEEKEREQQQSKQQSKQRSKQNQSQSTDGEDSFTTKKNRNQQDIANFDWGRFYGILDIPANSNDYEKIRMAYKVTVKTLHPDRYDNSPEETKDMMRKKYSHLTAGMKLVQDSRTYKNTLP